jgi:hypothetical protein
MKLENTILGVKYNGFSNQTRTANLAFIKVYFFLVQLNILHGANMKSAHLTRKEVVFKA